MPGGKLRAPGLLSAATALTALVLAGCASSADQNRAGGADQPRPTIAATTPANSAPPGEAGNPGPLPAPQVLTDVMNRLADPAVPAAEKLRLVTESSPADAGALDEFAAALRDGGFVPVAFNATDLRWSGEPGEVLATVTVTTTNPANTTPFSFPMAFRNGADGWQLTRQTAEMLFAFGNARAPGR